MINIIVTLAMELRSSVVANNANKVWGMPDRGGTPVRPTPDELQP
ncbi:MAG: hypothetical protein ACLU4N_17200 [Butyricimonas faecihominis]